MKKKILILGNKSLYLKILERLLSNVDLFDLLIFQSYQKLTDYFLDERPDIFLALADIDLEGCETGAVIDFLISENIPVITVLSKYDIDMIEALWKKGVVHCMVNEHHLDLKFAAYFVERLSYFNNKKAIIVDDSTTFRKLTKNHLDYLMFDVLTFDDGRSVVEYINDDSKSNEDVKLVIVDYNLPGMTGIELTRHIRDKLGFNVIIIAVTGHSSNEVKYGFIKSGADDYLIKPFSREEFNSVILKNMRLIEQVDRIEKISITDNLTQIYNRNFMKDSLAKQIDLAQRYNKIFSLILFDLDHFKSINDQYGHDKGDHVLAQFSKLVSDNIRKTDVFARWGGEEFLLLCPKTNKDQAQKLAEQLKRVLEKTSFGFEKSITCSVGISEYTADSNFEELVKKADIAMYKAKEKGRNNIVVY